MAQSPEFGAIWQLAVAFLIALEFLVLRLLYDGISAAVSTRLVLPLVLPIAPPESSDRAQSIFEVIPRPPRLFA